MGYKASDQVLEEYVGYIEAGGAAAVNIANTIAQDAGKELS
jgi:hypothetical protein